MIQVSLLQNIHNNNMKENRKHSSNNNNKKKGHHNKRSSKKKEKRGKKEKTRRKREELTDEQIEKSYTGLDRDIAEGFIARAMEPGISINRGLNSSYEQDDSF